MTHKKGISPLIATVLLIGFTVALAAVLMTWGLDYIKKSTEQVGSKTDEFLACSNVDFKITDVDCVNNEVTIQNDANIDIVNITIRMYVGTTIQDVFSLDGIPAFGGKAYDNMQGINLAGITKVESIAFIKVKSGAIVSCKDNVKEFKSNCP